LAILSRMATAERLMTSAELGLRRCPSLRARRPTTEYKDFGSFKICGEGEFPKTFLLKGEPAKGKAL
jgi:hypothetical protein